MIRNHLERFFHFNTELFVFQDEVRSDSTENELLIFDVLAFVKSTGNDGEIENIANRTPPFVDAFIVSFETSFHILKFFVQPFVFRFVILFCYHSIQKKCEKAVQALRNAFSLFVQTFGFKLSNEAFLKISILRPCLHPICERLREHDLVHDIRSLDFQGLSLDGWFNALRSVEMCLTGTLIVAILFTVVLPDDIGCDHSATRAADHAAKWKQLLGIGFR